MTYIPYLGTFCFSRYPSVALARNIYIYYPAWVPLNTKIPTTSTISVLPLVARGSKWWYTTCRALQLCPFPIPARSLSLPTTINYITHPPRLCPLE